MTDVQLPADMLTGDPHVDEQHRGIYSLALSLVRPADDGPAEVIHALDALMAHVDEHFLTEEDLMRRLGYPADETERHVREHRLMTQSAREMVLAFRTGALQSTEPLARFLREWLDSHVNECDRVLVEFPQGAR